MILARWRSCKRNERIWNATENWYLFKKCDIRGKMQTCRSYVNLGLSDLLRSGKFALNALPRFLWISGKEFVASHDDLWFGIVPLLNYYFQLCILQFSFFFTTVSSKDVCSQFLISTTYLFIKGFLMYRKFCQKFDLHFRSKQNLHRLLNIFVLKDPTANFLGFLMILLFLATLSSPFNSSVSFL